MTTPWLASAALGCGIGYFEALDLSPREVLDVVACRAVASGTMREVRVERMSLQRMMEVR